MCYDGSAAEYHQDRMNELQFCQRHNGAYIVTRNSLERQRVQYIGSLELSDKHGYVLSIAAQNSRDIVLDASELRMITALIETLNPRSFA